MLQIDLQFHERKYLSFAYPELEGKRVDSVIRAFESHRVARVHKVQEEAKREAQTLGSVAKIDVEDLDWDQYTTECNICHSDAFLSGATDIEAEGPDRDGDYLVSLEFKAHSFRCDGCGLELKDAEEMTLAGVDTVFDRSDQMEEWNETHAHYDEEWYR